ncbi:hypothetical protein G4V39_08420 [Thermosulfuriphilus ammonigenes]|uniref:Uncharacterized protein n=1 Tax=Thermosulfuriphilus ammonigenes TaxID=1936021 RepID=A0A6G7PXA7_9BACT|nr:dynamin family protein [Thermosulfuriphilus ammonigenes]MBA2849604.1 GTP-binding protein EngB required for normal cell division [Thermosulfuriphilus ammonigenes]QIJ72292.1 hypothetical protein G4V39_08420 [Thermosulfuriphilus ammonigenes]
MKTSYSLIKEGLGRIVTRLSQINPENGHHRLREISQKLKEEQFNLVVMGQFKRGKSTFVNALLGAEILPTAIVPLTAIVTVLRYGPEVKALVHYLDGRSQEVAISEIPQFVTERGNPKNRLQVKEVEVFYPSDYLKDGVRIIDTPGVGSVYRHNTDVAYAYLPYVDAGIFIVTADPPLSESEHQFLKDVRDHVDKLFFVLNKIDLVDEVDLAEALAFTEEILRLDLGREVRIYPLSAKLALEGKIKADPAKLGKSRFVSFERDLRAFLHQEKGKAFLKAVISSLLRHVADETMAYKLEQEAAKLSLDQLQKKIAQFEEKAQLVEKDRSQMEFILEGEIKKLTEMLDEDLRLLKETQLPELLRRLEMAFSEKVSRGLSSRELEREMEEFVFGEIQRVFSLFRNRESEKMAEALESIYLDLAGRTNQIIETIVRLASDLFKIELKPFTTVEKLTSKSDFYFLLREDPVGLELIQLSVRSALPMFIARGIILRRMRATIADRFERHCGRVRYDLLKRIDSTTRDFRRRLNEKIDLTLSAIREALQRAMALKSQSEQKVSETLSNLSARLAAVEEIRRELFGYQKEVETL